jgi:hypothetical protein
VWILQRLYAAARLTLLFRKFREVCRLGSLHNEIIVKNVVYMYVSSSRLPGCNSSAKLLQSDGTLEEVNIVAFKRDVGCRLLETIYILAVLYWVPVATITSRSPAYSTTPPTYSTVVTKADDSLITSLV